MSEEPMHPGQHFYQGVSYPEFVPKDSLEKIQTMEFGEEDVIVNTFPKAAPEKKMNEEPMNPGEFFYQGVSYPNVVSKDSLEKIQTMEFNEADVIVSTFPKSGTHWILAVVKNITKLSKKGPALCEDITEENKQTLMKNHLVLECQFPGYESTLDILKKIDQPKLMCSHLHASFFKKPLESKKTKFIVLYRNEKDVLVSRYNFVTNGIGEFLGTWDEFYDYYQKGVTVFGRWVDWVISWHEYKDHENILFLRYEDMKENLTREMRKIAKFLDRDLQEIDQIIENCSVKTMKKDDKIHIRKGITGEWKQYFSREQSAEFDKVYEDNILSRGLVMKYSD